MTSLIQTLRSVPSVSVLERFDSTKFLNRSNLYCQQFTHPHEICFSPKYKHKRSVRKKVTQDPPGVYMGEFFFSIRFANKMLYIFLPMYPFKL